MNKDILNINNKRQCHGYQEWYHSRTNKLNIRVVYKNGVDIGYEECHTHKETRFYIK